MEGQHYFLLPEVQLMGEIEEKREQEPKVPLWQKGWKAGPLTCSVPRLFEPTPSPPLSTQTKG